MAYCNIRVVSRVNEVAATVDLNRLVWVPRQEILRSVSRIPYRPSWLNLPESSIPEPALQRHQVHG